jgi:uncharacterized iron-regulated membrane protein
MDAKRIKTWYLIHKWTSLVCTVFLLLLCITGLPLIFYEEIDHLLGTVPEPQTIATAGSADLDRIVEAGLARYPGEAALYLSFDDHEPLIYLTLAENAEAPPENMRTLVYDARTGAMLGEPRFNEGIMYILFRLHTDMFLGLPGMLFLGAMGVLFVVAIVSGAVIYGPFMRRLSFGTVRAERGSRVKWLDLHNLLGVVTLAWALVVGATGVINTLAQPIVMLWQQDELGQMLALYSGKPAVARPGSVQLAVRKARALDLSMTPSFVAYPGTPFSTDHHYAVFMRGQTPLSARLLKPALIDAETGNLIAFRDLPWYVTMLLVSQPLHFGDYGSLPLKILWALLDAVTIIVLASGLYLWLGRRRLSLEARLAELERGGTVAASSR